MCILPVERVCVRERENAACRFKVFISASKAEKNKTYLKKNLSGQKKKKISFTYKELVSHHLVLTTSRNLRQNINSSLVHKRREDTGQSACPHGWRERRANTGSYCFSEQSLTRRTSHRTGPGYIMCSHQD